MAKLTINQSHVDLYPSLEKYLGQTVDASVIQDAKGNQKVAKKVKPKK